MTPIIRSNTSCQRAISETCASRLSRWKDYSLTPFRTFSCDWVSNLHVYSAPVPLPATLRPTTHLSAFGIECDEIGQIGYAAGRSSIRRPIHFPFAGDDIQCPNTRVPACGDVIRCGYLDTRWIRGVVRRILLLASLSKAQHNTQAHRPAERVKRENKRGQTCEAPRY